MTSPTFISRGARNHQRLMLLVDRGLSLAEAARRLGVTEGAARSLVDEYGKHGERARYPVKPMRCPMCGYRITIWPCVTCDAGD